MSTEETKSKEAAEEHMSEETPTEDTVKATAEEHISEETSTEGTVKEAAEERVSEETPAEGTVKEAAEERVSEETPTEGAVADADTTVSPVDSGVVAEDTGQEAVAHKASVFGDAPMPPLPEHPDAAKKATEKTTDRPESADAVSADSSGDAAYGHDDTQGPKVAKDKPSSTGGGDYSQGRYSTSVGEDEERAPRYQDRYSSGSSRSGGGGSRGGSGGGGRSRYRYRIDKEQLASMNINYKNPDALRRFTTETGTILPRRVTGISATDQRRVVHEIKRARFLALLPMG